MGRLKREGIMNKINNDELEHALQHHIPGLRRRHLKALRSCGWSDEHIVDYIAQFFGERIEALRWEAGGAGDEEMVGLCDVALSEDATASERAEAALECLWVIENGEAAH